VARFRITARREVKTEDEVTVDIEAPSDAAAERVFSRIRHDDLVDVSTFGATDEWDTSGDWYVCELEELADDDEDCGVTAAVPGGYELVDVNRPEVTITRPSGPEAAQP